MFRIDINLHVYFLISQTFQLICNDASDSVHILRTAIFFSSGPHFAAVNHNNEIIVTDFHNHSVKARAVTIFFTKE